MEMIGLGPPRPAGPGARGRQAQGQGPGHPARSAGRVRRAGASGAHAPRDYRAGAGGRPKIKGTGVGSGRIPGPARTKAVNRNAKRLLVYVLDVAATLAQNQVVIDLARRQRKTTGEWGPLRPWYYAPHAAHVKYDPEDRLILALLDEAQAIAPTPAISTPGRALGASARHPGRKR